MTADRGQERALAQDLRRAGAGQVLLAGDPGFELARRVWNGAIDRHPMAVARPASAGQVATTVRVAARSGLPLAVRGGGHSIAGFGTCDGGIVLDLSGMNEVRVSGSSRSAGAGPGCTWGKFDAATQAHGLATTGGLVSSTGVAGLTLGGGIGWLTRPAGLACDNLLGAQVVTATGEIVEASHGVNDDLFWALRGGGGNFGVVTRFHFRLHPVATVQAGMMLWPHSAAGEVTDAYAQWAASASDEFTTMLAFVTAPDIPDVPEGMRGMLSVGVVGCHVGAAHDADAELAPLRALAPPFDHVGAMPYVQLQRLFDEDVPAGARYYFTGGFADGLPTSLLATLRDQAAQRPSAGCEIDVHHMGGAAARVGEADSAYSGRAAAFTFNIITGWEDAAEDDEHIAWARATRAALQPFWRDTNYINFTTDTADDAGTQQMYGKQRYDRLRQVKRTWDPGNLFALNQNIRP
jgi:FAD/FMN-containing dehydrogenase